MNKMPKFKEPHRIKYKGMHIFTGWFDDQGESPGRYLYWTDVTPKGVGHDSAESAFQEYNNIAKIEGIAP